MKLEDSPDLNDAISINEFGVIVDVPDYVHHVQMTHLDFKHMTWCGQRAIGWNFVDAEHAAENGRKDGRMVACKNCVSAITKALQNGHDDF